MSLDNHYIEAVIFNRANYKYDFQVRDWLSEHGFTLYQLRKTRYSWFARISLKRNTNIQTANIANGINFLIGYE
jgi:hypothetical protein